MSESHILLDTFAPEDLHPDLLPYVCTGPMGQMIHHPLIISVIYNAALNKLINTQYKAKFSALLRAKEAHNWSSFVAFHERPYRLEALLQLVDEKAFTSDDIKYWKLVAWIWTDSENIYENFSKWLRIWSYSSHHRLQVMEEDDQKAFSQLPETFTIWRGASHKNVSQGLSWTLDKDKAVWFAKRLAGRKALFLAEGVVEKKDVFAYFSSRNEDEIVVSPKYVRDIKVSRVKKVKK